MFAVVLGAVSLTSCKKDYTCTIDFFGEDIVTEYNGLSSSEADDVEATCTGVGGTWATK